MTRIAFAVAAVTVWALSGCGDGKDPYDIFSNPPTIPSIGLPVTMDAPTITSAQVNPATRYRLDLIVNGGVSGTVGVVSPVKGFVAAIDGTVAPYSVTIFYNPQFTFQISNLTGMNKRIGDPVAEGEIVGSTLNGYTISMIAFVNGTASCPYPYFNPTTQEWLRVNRNGGNALCP